MGRLMSLLANPNNNIHENPVYNYKFPTSISNNFNDNYFFCGYKCRKSNIDKLIFHEERLLNNLEISKYTPSLPLSFATDGVKPISFKIYPHRNSFKIIQSDKCDGVKLQFIFDADCACQIDVFHCAFEGFAYGLFTYTLEPKFGSTHCSNHPAGPNQPYEYEFDRIQLQERSQDNSLPEPVELIPFVVVLSTSEDGCREKQQFVTHLSVDARSDSPMMSSAQVTVQKLVHGNSCFLMQDMYGAELLSEQDIVHNASRKSSMSGDLRTPHSEVDRPRSCDNREQLILQDCVICMAAVRDTLVLPCRHLCLCSSCGDKLLHQSPACPICRSAFRALLQIENLNRYLVTSDTE